MVLIIALVKGIDISTYEDRDELPSSLDRGRKKLAPLGAERLVRNIILLYNSIGNESLDLWYVARKL